MRLDLDECNMRLGTSEVPFVIFAPDEAWFRGRSLAEALDYTNPVHALEHVLPIFKMSLAQLYESKGGPLKSPKILKDKDVSHRPVQVHHTTHAPTLGTTPPQNLSTGGPIGGVGSVSVPTYAVTLDHHNAISTWVNESGLYQMLLGCKKPEAHSFKHWVLADVLPTLRKAGRYSMGLDDTEQALMTVHANQPVLYMGTVGVHDGVHLVKYGSTDDIYRRTVKEHKRDFSDFQLKIVIPCQHNRHAEEDFKAHAVIKDRRCKRVINGKVQTELLELSHSFTIRDAEHVMKMVVLQQDLMQDTDMHRLIALAADERKTKREAHELAMRKLEADTQLELKRLDHALEMKKLELETLRLSSGQGAQLPPVQHVQLESVQQIRNTNEEVQQNAVYAEPQEIPQSTSPLQPATTKEGVWQIHLHSGQRVQYFPSAKQAAIFLGAQRGGLLQNRAQSIMKCTRGVIPAYAGFQWERGTATDVQ